MSFEKRFWDKVDKDGPAPVFNPSLGPCWLWTASLTNTGYGNFTVSYKVKALPHRISYTLLRGPIPPGLMVDHLCRVRHCVNPAHLRIVTNQENLKAEGSLSPTKVGGANFNAQAYKTQCLRGHDFTISNTYNYRGTRSCKICKIERQRTYRKAA